MALRYSVEVLFFLYQFLKMQRRHFCVISGFQVALRNMSKIGFGLLKEHIYYYIYFHLKISLSFAKKVGGPFTEALMQNLQNIRKKLLMTLCHLTQLNMNQSIKQSFQDSSEPLGLLYLMLMFLSF